MLLIKPNKKARNQAVVQLKNSKIEDNSLKMLLINRNTINQMKNKKVNIQ